MLINIYFFVSLGLLAIVVLMIPLKIFLDTRISAKTRTEYANIEITRFIENERHKRIGERHLCSDCKLHKWFMIGIDGEVVIKAPGKIEVLEETLIFKGKVPE